MKCNESASVSKGNQLDFCPVLSSERCKGQQL
jgi:hypothetical protein